MGARAVVVGAAVVVALAGAAVAADRWALGVAEDRIAESVTSELDSVSGDPGVTVTGFPFLTQLAAGTLDDVSMTLAGAVVDDLELRDVDVRAADVSTQRPYTSRSAWLTASGATLAGVDLTDVTAQATEVTTGDPFTAASARLSGTLTTATLERLVAERSGLGDVRLAVAGNRVTATGRVLGLDVVAQLVPRPQGRAVAVDVHEVEVGGLAVDVDELPRRVRERLSGVTLPVDGLPEGMRLTGVTVTDAGMRITVEGEDVTLTAPG